MRRCPFHELAEAHPEIVCSVHRGMISGALAELGSELRVERLDAFVEPNLCIARLTRTEPGSRRADVPEESPPLPGSRGRGQPSSATVTPRGIRMAATRSSLFVGCGALPGTTPAARSCGRRSRGRPPPPARAPTRSRRRSGEARRRDSRIRRSARLLHLPSQRSLQTTRRADDKRRARSIASILVRAGGSKWRFDLGDAGAALRVPSYRAWFLSQVVSTSGVFAQAIGVAWLVLELGGNAIDLALVSAATFAPVFFGGVWAGGLADRVDRRRLLLATQSSFLLVALCLFLVSVTDAAQLWILFALSFAAGCVLAVDGPARQVYPARSRRNRAGGQRRRPVRGRPERVAGVRPRAGRAAHRNDRRLGVLRRDGRVVPLPDRGPPPLPAGHAGRPRRQ